MKNIPLFTTDFGVAELILEEVPYKKEAYVRLLSSCEPEKLLEECIAFCRTVGVDAVFASGDLFLEKYPLYTELIRMQCYNVLKPNEKLHLCPVNTDNFSLWCDIYNKYMRSVPTAVTIGNHNKRLYHGGKNCYFVYDGDALIGIGMVCDNTVDVVIRTVPGRGEDVMRTLCCAISDFPVTVVVAKNNFSAVSLYKRMGFLEIESTCKWFAVYKR